MNEQILRDHYKKRGCSDAVMDEAVTAVCALQSFLEERSSSLEKANREEIRTYLAYLIRQEKKRWNHCSRSRDTFTSPGEMKSTSILRRCSAESVSSRAFRIASAH